MADSRLVVLHVCLGNICRSPMSQRLLTAHMDQVLETDSSSLLLSHSAGLGDWHIGYDMDSQAAGQLEQRGVHSTGHSVQRITYDMITDSDLILTATSEHLKNVVHIQASASAKTFVLGEYARLLVDINLNALPVFTGDASSLKQRGIALSAAVATARGQDAPWPEDEISDPWQLGEARFSRVADRIEDCIGVISRALAGLS